jgi:Fe2+-dicitrate sensor, membrane component
MAVKPYIEVATKTATPCRLEVDRLEVLVPGTSSNTHANEEAVTTTVVEGAAKLNVAGKAYSLSPGFEANVDQGGVKIVKSDVYEQIAWKDGRFVFREKRLEEVMSIVSRWYDCEIFYQNAAVKDWHSTGNIPRHATINDSVEIFGTYSPGTF